MIAFDTGTLLGVVIGALAALTIEHGWGWVLAQYHARKARAESQAKSLYDEVSGAVRAAIAPLRADLDALKADVDAIKTKLPQA